jgi:hypothetical protein
VKLHALICVYNAHETIWDCLESLIDVVDRIVILDGRWIGFEGESVVSNDGTSIEIEEFIAMCKQQTEVDIEYFTASTEHHQYEARTFLLDQVPVGDWFFMIDSDEIIIKIPQNLRVILEDTKENVNGYRTGQIDETGVAPKPFPHARLLRKTEGLRYTTNHRYLEDIRGPFDTIHCPALPELVIMHKGKDKASRAAMQDYKKWRNKWEASQNYRSWLYDWEQNHPA